MSARGHVADLAELYALGALEPAEASAVDAHAAQCPECAAALGRADAALAELDDAGMQIVEPPERLAARIAASARAVDPSLQRRVATRTVPARWLALAAAVALAIGLGGGAALERAGVWGGASDADDLALATIANSHFLHVSFSPRAAGAPVAKALYARDGAWLYLIVDARACGCTLAVRGASGLRELGAPHPHGSTETLFVRHPPFPSVLVLRSGDGRALADARLVR